MADTGSTGAEKLESAKKDSVAKLTSLLDAVESYDAASGSEKEQDKELTPQEREAIKKRMEEFIAQKTHAELEKLQGFLATTAETKDNLDAFHVTLKSGETQQDDIGDFMIVLEERLEAQERDPEKHLDEESRLAYQNARSEFDSVLQSLGALGQEHDRERNAFLGLSPEEKKNQREVYTQKIELLERRYEDLDYERSQSSESLYQHMLVRRSFLDKLKQDGKITPEKQGELDNLEKELKVIDDIFLYNELRSKQSEQLSEDERTQIQKLAENIQDNPIAQGILDQQTQEDIDLQNSIPIEEDKMIRQLDNGYEAKRTGEIVDAIKQKEGEEVFKLVEARVLQVSSAFEKAGVKDPTLLVLKNMLWRHASNNPDFRSDKADLPFLAQDVSTKQAFIYYPGGEVEISRAYHGSGKIGDNRHGKHGTTLGSKRLSKGHTGGRYRYRLYVQGLERGINHNDHDRLVRIHEKDGGNTIGCTGLPTSVMARFHRAVSEAGGGSQEVFVSNGVPVQEKIARGVRTSGDLTRRALDGGFKDMAEVDKFLEALDRNLIAKAMLSLIAPFGLMVARWDGDEEMEYFWKRIMGEDIDENSPEGRARSDSQGRTPNYSREYSQGTLQPLNPEQIKEIEGIKVDASAIARWEGIDIGTNAIGGASGHTIGAGYDLRYYPPEKIAKDWGPYFGDHPKVMQALQACSGKPFSHSRANTLRSAIQSSYPGGFEAFKAKIREAAPLVLQNSTLPDFIYKTKQVFPNLDKLSPEAQTALVGLVFNRGAGTSGNTRIDMLRIRQHMQTWTPETDPVAFYNTIAGHVENMNHTMAHKWRNLGGVRRRRREEAAMIRSNPTFVGPEQETETIPVPVPPVPESNGNTGAREGDVEQGF